MPATTVGEMLTVFLGGACIGFLFFGGLYWTVMKLPYVKKPWLWTTASFAVRTAAAAAGLYVISGDRWERLLIALAGFVLVRMAVVRKVKPEPGVSKI